MQNPQITKIIEDTVAEYKCMPVFWSMFPDYPPYEIGWRMGPGEMYLKAWHIWWKEQNYNYENRLDYLIEYGVPDGCILMGVCLLFQDDLKDKEHNMNREEMKPYFSKFEDLGFGSFDDWINCPDAPRRYKDKYIKV